jgi:hypothetical protein
MATSEEKKKMTLFCVCVKAVFGTYLNIRTCMYSVNLLPTKFSSHSLDGKSSIFP